MKKLLGSLILSVLLVSTVNLSAQTVYTNKADSKYHLLTCRYLDPSHDSLDMAFAVKKGFKACPVCNPSGKGTSSKGSMSSSQGMGSSQSMGSSGSMGSSNSMERSGMKQDGNSSANLSDQCSAIGRDGKRCIGMTEPGSKYCWEHRNYKK